MLGRIRKKGLFLFSLFLGLVLVACSIYGEDYELSEFFPNDINVYFNLPCDPPAQQANLEEVIISLLALADSTIDIAVYDLDLLGIAQKLVEQHDDGVTVRLITDNDNVDTEDNTEVYSLLIDVGVPWIDDTADGSAGSSLQHNKFIVVDGEYVLTGSTNFTQSGIHGDLDENGNVKNRGNANNIVIIRSSQLADAYTAQFSQM